MMSFQIVNHRLDAATLAYRVAFPRTLVDELVSRSNVAKKHGRSEFLYGDVKGEMRYSRADRAWLVVCPRFRVRFVMHAPGAVGDEPGWTFEVVWSAGALAKMTPERVRRASHRIARSCGTVYGARLRRMDLCADVAGWNLSHQEVENFVRRPNARIDAHAFSDEDVLRLEDSGELDEAVPAERVVTHYKTSVTGFTFCPGAPMMARIYDKLAELKLKKPEIQEEERARFLANGWDGVSPVTRVEFQIRGEALRDFGLRDPDAPTQDVRDQKTRKLATVRVFKGFEEVLDRVWRAALSWLRLTKPDQREERASRRATDDRWLAMARLAFSEKTVDGEHLRVRRRGGASVDQTLGCVLSTLGQAGRLHRLSRMTPDEVSKGRATIEVVKALFDDCASVVARALFQKWGDDEAWEHVIEVNNATRAREFDEMVGSPAWLDDAPGVPLAAAC
jgi:hypothetical protein